MGLTFELEKGGRKRFGLEKGVFGRERGVLCQSGGENAPLL